MYETVFRPSTVNSLGTGVLGAGSGGSSIPRLEEDNKSCFQYASLHKGARTPSKPIPTFV